jgi:hypothetical protein
MCSSGHLCLMCTHFTSSDNSCGSSLTDERVEALSCTRWLSLSHSVWMSPCVGVGGGSARVAAARLSVRKGGERWRESGNSGGSACSRHGFLRHFLIFTWVNTFSSSLHGLLNHLLPRDLSVRGSYVATTASRSYL